MSSSHDSERPLSAVVLTVFVLVAALAGVTAFAGAAAAANAGGNSAGNTAANSAVNGAVVAPQPARGNATSTHETHLAVHAGTSSVAGASWTGYRVNYQNTDVSNVDQSDIVLAGIDRGNNETGTQVDVNATNDVSGVSASNNGHSLTISLGGNSNIHNGDELVVVYSGVQNAGANTTESVTLVANPQSSGYKNSTNVSYHPPASVSLPDQTVNGTRTLTIGPTSLPNGGRVTVQNSNGTRIASSNSLDAGTHENVTVTLPKGSQPGAYTAVARHSDGSAYVHNNGSTVEDTGTVTRNCHFSAAFENSTRTNANAANYTLSATCGDYNARVSATNLTASDLTHMFGNGTVISSDSANDTVTVPGGQSVTDRLNVSNYTGNYTFHATDLQTNAEDDASLTLTHTQSSNTTTSNTTSNNTTTSNTTSNNTTSSANTTTTTSTTTTSSSSTSTSSSSSGSSSPTSSSSGSTTPSGSSGTSTSGSSGTSGSGSTTASSGTSPSGGSNSTQSTNATNTTSASVASVTFRNQTRSNETVTVRNATLPAGGYVALERNGSVVAHTDLLDAGTHANVSLAVDVTGSARLDAVAMRNTDGSPSYSANDTAYEHNGSVVDDTATITAPVDQATTTSPPQTTASSSGNATPQTSAGGLRWVALLAVLAAAAGLIVVVRRLR